MDAINLKHKSLAKVGQKSNKYMRKNYGALNSSKYGIYQIQEKEIQIDS